MFLWKDLFLPVWCFLAAVAFQQKTLEEIWPQIFVRYSFCHCCVPYHGLVFGKLKTEVAVVRCESRRAAHWYLVYGASSNLVCLATWTRLLPVMGRLYKYTIFHSANTSTNHVRLVQAWETQIVCSIDPLRPEDFEETQLSVVAARYSYHRKMMALLQLI